MQFSKAAFILTLATLFVLPFVINRLVWLYHSVPATGTMCFMGKTLDGQFGSEYPVIKFSSNGKDTIFFKGNHGPQYNPGDIIPIRFQKNNPADARINKFTNIWVDTIIDIVVPAVFLLIVFLHPGIIPHKSKIVVGKKPFIRLV
jgi:hypothetical protein